MLVVTRPKPSLDQFVLQCDYYLLENKNNLPPLPTETISYHKEYLNYLSHRLCDKNKTFKILAFVLITFFITKYHQV